MFRELSINMASTSHPGEDDEEIELFQSQDDPWIKHFNTLLDTRFEQHEPPTEDKIIQVNLGIEEYPKPIFISESLSPCKKKDLIQLICQYINVLAWSYEDMPWLDPQVAKHRLNINSYAKLVKQQQRQFRPKIKGSIESEVKKLIDFKFLR